MHWFAFHILNLLTTTKTVCAISANRQHDCYRNSFQNFVFLLLFPQQATPVTTHSHPYLQIKCLGIRNNAMRNTNTTWALGITTPQKLCPTHCHRAKILHKCALVVCMLSSCRDLPLLPHVATTRKCTFCFAE